MGFRCTKSGVSTKFKHARSTLRPQSPSKQLILQNYYNYSYLTVVKITLRIPENENKMCKK